MTSPIGSIPFSIDDKDLDDAALWAVIDSAAASVSHSSTSASKYRKPLAIRYPNYRSPPTPISHASPPSNPKHHNHHNRRQRQYSPNSDSRGEIVNDRPQKMARTYSSEASESSPIVLMHRTPPSPATYPCPEAYLSPGINGRNEEREQDVMRHSLPGRFPSVSLFKEYQNAAMGVFVLIWITLSMRSVSNLYSLH